ncbi:hypothetical protein DYB26_001852 [Aphanomyces astaci]|uniref:Centrosomal protein CEP104 N-terminal domain-containing protein n=1 Tax=Aphanomyces astaci TaxID=112090 RepID=A0A418EXJ2_APHAT|nr:hypothetical protein DYB26_001852 [Aphanomyces astaci]
MIAGDNDEDPASLKLLADQVMRSLVSSGCRLVCVDFDSTFLRIHTNGSWSRPAAELLPYVRCVLHRRTKLPYVASAALEASSSTSSADPIRSHHTVLIDDCQDNVFLASQCGIAAIHYDPTQFPQHMHAVLKRRKKRRRTSDTNLTLVLPSASALRRSIQSPVAGQSEASSSFATAVLSPVRSADSHPARLHFCTPSPVTKLRVTNSIGKPKPKRYTRPVKVVDDPVVSEQVVADLKPCHTITRTDAPCDNVQDTCDDDGGTTQDVVEIRSTDVIEMLVHHTKIPSRIDIFVAESAVTKLRKLGYVAMDSNESSNFNARELKCITIDCAVAYFKLSLHQCHRNRFNVFDQVGLVDITLLGSPAKASATTTSLPSLNPIMHLPNNNNHPASNSPRTQCDTASLELYHIPHPSHPGTRLSLRQLVEALRIQRATCVDAEDYAAAKHTKDLERTVLQCFAQLERLHLQKNSVLQVENYDGASLVKAEMDVVIAQACEGVGGILTRIDGRTFCCAYSRHRTLREPATADIVHAIQTLGHFSQNGSSASALEKLVLPWLTTGILQQPVHVHVE